MTTIIYALIIIFVISLLSHILKSLFKSIIIILIISILIVLLKSMSEPVVIFNKFIVSNFKVETIK